MPAISDLSGKSLRFTERNGTQHKLLPPIPAAAGRSRNGQYLSSAKPSGKLAALARPTPKEITDLEKLVQNGQADQQNLTLDQPATCAMRDLSIAIA